MTQPAVLTDTQPPPTHSHLNFKVHKPWGQAELLKPQLPITHQNTHLHDEANAPRYTHLHSHCNYKDSCRCQVITSSAWCKLSGRSYSWHFLISCQLENYRYSLNYSVSISSSLLSISTWQKLKNNSHIELHFGCYI